MKRYIILFAVMALAVGLLAAPVSAGAQTADDSTIAGNDYVTVTLTGSPAAADDSTKVNGRFDPASKGYQQALSRMQRQHDKFAERLARVAPDAEIVDEYFITANAVALKLNGSSLSKIGKIAGVEKTAESALYSLDLNKSVDLIKAPEFWSTPEGQSSAGEGVKVGVIDSGIDPTHPFFACKDVQFGGIYYSGVGMAPPNAALPAYFGPHYSPEPGWPLYFSAAHGTHVAGIIGGCVTTIGGYSDLWDRTTLSGVAPGAELWDYNVFPAFGAGYVAFGGSAFSHDIARAIEDAVTDGMNVINMSLGGGVQGPHDFLAEVANEAVDAGVVVVASAGNEGPGWYTVGSPGSASEVIAVGATTNSRTTGVVIQVSDGPTYYAVPSQFPSFDGSTYDLVLWTGDDPEACSISNNENHSDKVVLISRGSCSFSQKIQNAYDTGAVGAVVYNYPGQEPIVMATSPGYPGEVPAVMVSYSDGMNLADTTASISPPTTVPATPDMIADFSSHGQAPFTNIIKPDVMAPGVDILSSTIQFTLLGDWIGIDDTWELYSGTSMASPHVAGSAAALLSTHDGWTVDEVRSALVNTANTSKPGLSVFEQGGGLVDLVEADSATVSFNPASASFGIFKGNKPASGSIDIAITGGNCSAGDISGNGDGYVSAGVSSSTLTVSFDGGRAALSGLYGGYVDVTCGSDDHYTIPWGAVVNR